MQASSKQLKQALDQFVQQTMYKSWRPALLGAPTGASAWDFTPTGFAGWKFVRITNENGGITTTKAVNAANVPEIGDLPIWINMGVDGRLYIVGVRNLGADVTQVTPLPVYPAYGELYTQDGSTAQTGITTTPILFTQWANAGLSFGTTASAANDSITVLTPGIYQVMVQASFSGTVSVRFEIHLRKNGVEQPEGFHRKLGTGGDVGSASFFALVSLSANDVLSCYIESDSGAGASMTLTDGQFVVTKIAEV